ncbi:PREDICTED: mediator of RNA polymerase II transcription subunit 30-like [Priapulus caudatus]|uniref:Mediator of RNA polymerase II transcription subunit 30 n=1 Tax=Priapulus caudatus TaxID=37621 RepID=A0ABM1ENS4_PRICU|nr:PREDICTED: mediator of RNA polymerase II transcription subunit 30-like [Priapulus caudatus]
MAGHAGPGHQSQLQQMQQMYNMGEQQQQQPPQQQQQQQQVPTTTIQAHSVVSPGFHSPPQSQTPGTISQSGDGAAAAGRQAAAPQASASPAHNTAWLCRMGQEMVQDIVTRTHEIFQLLRTMQLPTGSDTVRSQQAQERLAKLKPEQLKQVSLYFRKLRAIYDKCNEQADFTDIETFVPLRDEEQQRPEERPVSDIVKYQSEDYKEIVAQLTAKNRQIKEVINYLRDIIWEINTMLATRKWLD